MTAAYAAVFGLAFGSFANAAIDRIARRRMLLGSSCCDRCGRRLAIWELIPLFSYALLRGHCHRCGSSIGLRTPAVEAACGVAAAGVCWQLGAWPALATGALAVTASCVVARWRRQGGARA